MLNVATVWPIISKLEPILSVGQNYYPGSTVLSAMASGWKPQVVPTVTGVAGAGLILQSGDAKLRHVEPPLLLASLAEFQQKNFGEKRPHFQKLRGKKINK